MKLRLPEELIFMQNSKLPQRKSDTSVKDKLCVITGATSGVGYEALLTLAAGGANIAIIARNEQKAIAVKAQVENKHHVSVDYFIADFSDLSQVRNVAIKILEKYSKIDILINCAGIHSTKKTYTKNGFETVFCVNHLASFLLTKMLLNRIVESAPARIIQVNSEGHRFSGVNIEDLNWHRRFYTGLRGYGSAKTAQLLTTWQFAEELKYSGVTINAVHPGAVKTNIGENNGKLYRWFSHNVTWKFLQDPKIAGEAIYYLAAAPELANTSGKFFNLTIEEKPAKHAMDEIKQKLIWDKSIEMTGLRND